MQDNFTMGRGHVCFSWATLIYMPQFPSDTLWWHLIHGNGMEWSGGEPGNDGAHSRLLMFTCKVECKAHFHF